MIKHILIGISLIIFSIYAMLYAINSFISEINTLSIIQLSIAIVITILTIYLIIKTLNFSIPKIISVNDFEINGQKRKVDIMIFSSDVILNHGLGVDATDDEISTHQAEIIDILIESLIVAFNKKNLGFINDPLNIRRVGIITLQFKKSDPLKIGFELSLNPEGTRISILDGNKI